MAKFNGKMTVYQACLGGYADRGFRLKPSPDGEILTLSHEGRKIAEFKARLLTPQALLTGCKNYLDNIAIC